MDAVKAAVAAEVVEAQVVVAAVGVTRGGIALAGGAMPGATDETGLLDIGVDDDDDMIGETRWLKSAGA